MLKSAASDFECEARADVIGILMPGLAVILLWGFSLIWLNFGAWRSVVKPSKYLWFFYPEGLERKDPIWEALFFRWVAKKQQAKLVDVPNRKNTAKILYRPVNILLQLAVREKRERKNSRWASSGPITPLMGVITAGTHLESIHTGLVSPHLKLVRGPPCSKAKTAWIFSFVTPCRDMAAPFTVPTDCSGDHRRISGFRTSGVEILTKESPDGILGTQEPSNLPGTPKTTK